MKDRRLADVWRQKDIPVVFRKKPPLLVKLPYHPHNRSWLHYPGKRRPTYNPTLKCWEVPNSWFEELVADILVEFGQVYIVEEYREQQRCAPACWNAKGFHCVCSCMALNHGAGRPPGESWYEISESCAVRWEGKSYSYRLLTTSRSTDDRDTTPP